MEYSYVRLSVRFTKLILLALGLIRYITCNIFVILMILVSAGNVEDIKRRRQRQVREYHPVIAYPLFFIQTILLIPSLALFFYPILFIIFSIVDMCLSSFILNLPTMVYVFSWPFMLELQYKHFVQLDEFSFAFHYINAFKSFSLTF